MHSPILLAVPNVSEGRDADAIDAIGRAFGGDRRSHRTRAAALGAGGEGAQAPAASGVRLLDVHSDGDHNRSVFTIAGPPEELARAVIRGATAAVERIDVMHEPRPGSGPVGQHPHVGALDVVPIVYLEHRARGAACAEALVICDMLSEQLGVPVFIYGELSGTPADAPAGFEGVMRPRTRAQLRRGGVHGLTARIASAGEDSGAWRPDFGPPRMHPTAGAVLVAAREPLVAFNLQLDAAATSQDATRIAGMVREGGPHGLRGVRAIGIELSHGRAQVSMNIERPLELTLAEVIAAVAARAQIESAELVGLAPSAAFEGFPWSTVPLRGFDATRHIIENSLAERAGDETH